MAEERTEKVRVEIFGDEYVIKKGANESQYIEILAKYVDKKMREVAENTALISTSKIAVLAALNITDELFNINNNKIKDKHLIKEQIAALIKKIDDELGQ